MAAAPAKAARHRCPRSERARKKNCVTVSNTCLDMARGGNEPKKVVISTSFCVTRAASPPSPPFRSHLFYSPSSKKYPGVGAGVYGNTQAKHGIKRRSMVLFFFTFSHTGAVGGNGNGRKTRKTVCLSRSLFASKPEGDNLHSVWCGALLLLRRRAEQPTQTSLLSYMCISSELFSHPIRSPRARTARTTVLPGNCIYYKEYHGF